MMTATDVWRTLLKDVLDDGVTTEQVSAGASWRGRTSSELLAHRTVWPMSRPVVLCPDRRLGYRFLAAEAAWILSGSNRLDEIVPYARHLIETSDDGEFLTGSYGPPWVDQLPYLTRTLAADVASRQAVSTIWRPRPGASKDVPCTIALQFIVRPGAVGPTLHTVASMRSSDAWLGVPYDVHAFSMCAAFLALTLRDRLGPLQLGNLYLTAGSQHLYALDRERATRCVWQEGVVATDALRRDEVLDLAPIDLREFDRPTALITHLWAIARRDRAAVTANWLAETLP